MRTPIKMVIKIIQTKSFENQNARTMNRTKNWMSVANRTESWSESCWTGGLKDAPLGTLTELGKSPTDRKNKNTLPIGNPRLGQLAPLRFPFVSDLNPSNQ